MAFIVAAVVGCSTKVDSLLGVGAPVQRNSTRLTSIAAIVRTLAYQTIWFGVALKNGNRQPRRAESGVGIKMPMDRHGALAAAQLSGRPVLAPTDWAVSGAEGTAQSGRKGRTGKSEPIAVQVRQFLAGHVPRLFCDDCITDQLGLSHRRQANRVTAAIGKSTSFWRDVAACSACRKHKQVIRHV